MRNGILSRVFFLCLFFALSSSSFFVRAQTETGVTEIPAAPSDAAASNDTLRANLQLQEQLHAAQLAIEEANNRSAEALVAQLRMVEQKLSTQGAEEARIMVYVLSSFAALSFLAVVITSYFQWRTVKRLTEFTTSLSLGRAFTPAHTGAFSLEDGLAPETIERSSNRLIGAVERLEKRILELEHAAMPTLKNGVVTENVSNGTNGHEVQTSGLPKPLTLSADLDQPERIRQLLERGQVLLSEDQPDAAIEALDLILALDSAHAEALVKKGAALEKLRKLSEAIECYDRAIAADSSLTIAYLHKGGLYNRMERFGEAVECYEKALRTQEKTVETLR